MFLLQICCFKEQPFQSRSPENSSLLWNSKAIFLQRLMVAVVREAFRVFCKKKKGYILTTKVYKASVNRFFKVYVPFEGLDGTRVIAKRFNGMS